MKCHVKGCTNHSEDGRFVGEFCSPCYRMLGNGFVSPSEAWFVKEIEKTKEVGEIVLTSTEDGELVAVTRQDEEGRILKLIWSKK